jgi:hypothetical protein
MPASIRHSFGKRPSNADSIELESTGFMSLRSTVAWDESPRSKRAIEDAVAGMLPLRLMTPGMKGFLGLLIERNSLQRATQEESDRCLRLYFPGTRTLIAPGTILM